MISSSIVASRAFLPDLRLDYKPCRARVSQRSPRIERFQGRGLGYSKDVEMHKLAVALHFGVYNFVRKHKTLGTTPAVAAGVELEPWSLERVVEMTENYLRSIEDAEFEEAFAKLV